MGMTVPEIRELLQRADEQELAALERSLAADTRKGVKKAIEVARRRIELEKAEAKRVRSLYEFERGFLPDGSGTIVGLDEVGRGAVAGPLAVGAVVLDPRKHIPGLNDSKQLSPESREETARQVRESAISFHVQYVPPSEIDRDGMSASLRKAFLGALRAIEEQGVNPDLVLIDGNPLHIDPREKNVVKGDAKCASIAAASIVAKVERDAYMSSLGDEYARYGFPLNKGYASQQHVDAIKEFGLSDVHRASFCKSFMQETLF